MKKGRLSERSEFLPFRQEAGRSSPTGTAGVLSFWHLFLSDKRKKKCRKISPQSYTISPEGQARGGGNGGKKSGARRARSGKKSGSRAHAHLWATIKSRITKEVVGYTPIALPPIAPSMAEATAITTFRMVSHTDF